MRGGANLDKGESARWSDVGPNFQVLLLRSGCFSQIGGRSILARGGRLKSQVARAHLLKVKETFVAKTYMLHKMGCGLGTDPEILSPVRKMETAARYRRSRSRLW